jgi:hypothetical protein
LRNMGLILFVNVYGGLVTLCLIGTRILPFSGHHPGKLRAMFQVGKRCLHEGLGVAECCVP